MVYVYLSDESLEAAKSSTIPGLGQHVGPWLPVLQDVAEWRIPRYVNKVATRLSLRSLIELGRVVNSLKSNSPASGQMLLLMTELQVQVASAEVVPVVERDEFGLRIEIGADPVLISPDLTTHGVVDFAEAERNVAEAMAELRADEEE